MERSTALLIVPDAPRSPFGGLGVHLKEVYDNPDAEIFGVDVVMIGSGHAKPFLEKHLSFHPISSFPVLVDSPIDQIKMNQTAIIAKVMELVNAGQKFDLIHAFDWSTYWAAVHLKRALNIPLVVSVHLSEYHLLHTLFKLGSPPPHPSIQNSLSLEMLAMEEADQILHVSQAYSDYYPAKFQEKSHVVYNGINFEEFYALRNETVKLPGKNKRKLVFIGRVDLQKGCDNLADCQIPSNCDLIVVGNASAGQPELLEYWKRQTKGQKNVFFLGSLWGKEKVKVLNAADAVIMPSRHEPFGIVALEALASKSVLITSGVDGIGEIIPAHNRISSGQTVESLQSALNQFAAMSDSEIQDMKRDGWTYVCNRPDFRWESARINIFKQYLRVSKTAQPA